MNSGHTYDRAIIAMTTEEIKPFTEKEVEQILLLLDLSATGIARELKLSQSAVSHALTGKKHLPTVVERAAGVMCQRLKEKLKARKAEAERQ